MRHISSLLLLLLTGFFNISFSQQPGNDTGVYKFTNVKIIKTTSVKDQGKSGTCWCFSTMSLVESELMRLGKGEYDLSEMFVVRHTYDNKADKYIRMQGNLEFSEGGEPNDVMDVIRTNGIVPKSAYSGFKPKETKVDHSEMEKVLKAYLDALIKPEVKTLSNVWFKGYHKVLDTYLGDLPAKFKYEGQEYTPVSFEEKLGFNPNDYVLFTSYTHHPFYQKFALEIPDNWSWEKYYNVPIDELIAIMDNALNNDYSVLWAADVSEKGFSFNEGTATIPDVNEKIITLDEWKKIRSHPTIEKTITQEMRQEQFDNFSTTDDHGMHMTGIAKDQNGKKFYYVKNSWGTDNLYAGYLYASEAYVRLKTMSIMVHKSAVPKEIRSKLKDWQ